ADPTGKANYEFARREKFILKEDRIFLRLASGPHGPRQMFQTDVTVKEGMEA
ncbi:MAG: NIPSNAP family protein, partial [Mesorhizobium sp.]